VSGPLDVTDREWRSTHQRHWLFRIMRRDAVGRAGISRYPNCGAEGLPVARANCAMFASPSVRSAKVKGPLHGGRIACYTCGLLLLRRPAVNNNSLGPSQPVAVLKADSLCSISAQAASAAVGSSRARISSTGLAELRMNSM
jgi:hypothetical protein